MRLKRQGGVLKAVFVVISGRGRVRKRLEGFRDSVMRPSVHRKLGGGGYENNGILQHF